MLDRPRDSKTGNSLYELVVARNFETIQNFLAKFHDIFSSRVFDNVEQDEFERGLERFEQKVDIVDRNHKKIEERMTKMNDVYEKKMMSLKQFIVQKIENSGTHSSSKNSSNQYNAKLSVQNKEQFMQQVKEHFYKKIQEVFTENCRKMEMDLSNVSRKINSLVLLNDTVDEKINSLFKKNKAILQQENEILNEKIEQVWSKLQNQFCEMSQKITKLESGQIKMTDIFETHNLRLNSADETCLQKLDTKVFEEFLQTLNNNQVGFAKQIQQNFSSKKEVKKMMNLFERKLIKLQIIEDILKDNNQNDSKLSVTTGNFQNRTRPLSIHNKKSDKPLTKTSDSIHIRKLSKLGQLAEKY